MKYDHRFDQSSMLQSVHYDDETNEMTAIFMNGKEYVYEDVQKKIYDELSTAPSAGRWFNAIKGSLKIKKDA